MVLVRSLGPLRCSSLSGNGRPEHPEPEVLRSLRAGCGYLEASGARQRGLLRVALTPDGTLDSTGSGTDGSGADPRLSSMLELEGQ